MGTLNKVGAALSYEVQMQLQNEHPPSPPDFFVILLTCYISSPQVMALSLVAVGCINVCLK